MVPDDAVPLPDTVPVRVAIGVVQVVSPGAYSRKVTSPVGENPPVSEAVSEMFPPAGTDPEGVVVMAGVALVTVTS